MIGASASSSLGPSHVRSPSSASSSAPASASSLGTGRKRPALDLAQLGNLGLVRGLRTGRDLVNERRDQLDDDLFATACPAFDGLLRGGLRRGRTTELLGWGSSGRFSLVLAALAAVTARGEAAALVDLGDALDPQRAADAGIVLDRLLWARPRTTKEALISAEVILEASPPLLVVDLGVPPVPGGRGGQAFWLRLARAAERHSTALLVSTPYRATGTAAHSVIEARDRRALWQGSGPAPRLLDGVGSRLHLAKGPGWQAARPTNLELRVDPGPPPESERTAEKKKISEKEKFLLLKMQRDSEKKEKARKKMRGQTDLYEQEPGRETKRGRDSRPAADPLMAVRRAIA